MGSVGDWGLTKTENRGPDAEGERGGHPTRGGVSAAEDEGEGRARGGGAFAIAVGAPVDQIACRFFPALGPEVRVDDP